MKHARQKIREAAATAITGIVTNTYTSRVYPMVTLPVISVFADTESSDSENELIGTPRRYSRELRLDIEVAVEAVSGFDDSMDDYVAQVEAAIEADVTLGGACTDIKLTGTQITMDGSGDTPVAVARLSYTTWYRTTGTDPENPL